MSYRNGLPAGEFNLPPGVTSRMIDEAFGEGEEEDDVELDSIEEELADDEAGDY